MEGSGRRRGEGGGGRRGRREREKREGGRVRFCGKENLSLVRPISL